MARILALASSYPRFDGDVIAPFIEHITHEVAGAGNEIDMVLPFHPKFEKKNTQNIYFHLFKYVSKPENNIWGYASSMKADVTLKKRVLFLAPKVVRRSLSLTKDIIGKNRPDLIHGHWLLPNGYIAYKLSNKFKIPYAISLHGSDVTVAERPLFKPFARRILKNASWISACSEDLRSRVIALGADPAKVTTIPYGVDVETFKPDPERKKKFTEKIKAKYKKGDKVILAVGRLVEKKGFIYLLDAMKTVLDERKDALLVFAGDGDLDVPLKNRMRELGIGQKVIFAGMVERDDLPVYFSGCDILAVPSVKDKHGNVDGLPNVLMEGFASGCAMVASEIAGIPNVMINGENGLLTEPENASGIAEALLRLIKDDKLRLKLGKNARKDALNKYTWKHTGEKYTKGLMSVIK